MKSKKTKNKSSSTENTPAMRSTDLEKARKVFEQYPDRHVRITPRGEVIHPIWGPVFYDAPLPDISQKLDRVQQVNQMVKTKLKEFIYSHSLEDIIQRLDPYYIFWFLRDAKEYLSTDDFTRIFRLASDKATFCYEYCRSSDAILELFKYCNLQKFMTDEEWERRRELQCRHSGSKIVYRGCGMRDDADAVTWVTNPSAPIRDERFRETLEIYDYTGFRAEIKAEDIIAVIHGDWEIYILDPDKLQNIKRVDLRDYCYQDELCIHDWESWEGQRNLEKSDP